MNTLDMVFAAVDSGNKKKEERNAKHQKYLEIFRNEGLESEYQAYVNGNHELELQIARCTV